MLLKEEPPSILFAESPVAKKKPPKLKNVLSEFKTNAQSEQTGIDLFADSPKRSPSFEEEKNNRRKKKSLNSIEFAENCPYVKQYIFFVKSQDFSIQSETENRVRIDKSVEQTYSLMNTIFSKIREVQVAMDEKNQKRQKKVDKLNKELKRYVQKRAACLIYYALKKDLNSLHEDYVQKISDNLVKCLEYIQIVHTENPDIDIKLNTHIIFGDINSFPQSDASAMRVLKHVRKLKLHLKKLKTKPLRQIKMKLKHLCKINNIDAHFNYFPDIGENFALFLTILDNLPKSFQKAVNKKIEQSVANPSTTGQNLFLQAQELCELQNLKQEKFLKYFFLYFSRHFFNEIYIRSLNDNVIPEKSFEFANRVHRLRKLTPIGFGIAQKYVNARLKSIPLTDFPEDHIYKEAVELFDQASYETSPIDFCHKVFNAFRLLQIQASEFDFDTKFKETGRIYARTDSLLTFDDLFDISIIIFLLSGAGDTYSLVTAFQPFINGLNLPSEYEFAFTNLHEICEQIAKMDIEKFISDAMDRTKKEQEQDPLKITDMFLK